MIRKILSCNYEDLFIWSMLPLISFFIHGIGLQSQVEAAFWNQNRVFCAILLTRISFTRMIEKWMETNSSKKLGPYSAGIDEPTNCSQDLSIKEVFPCFSKKPFSFHLNCLSLLQEEYDEVNICSRCIASGRVRTKMLNNSSHDLAAPMECEQDMEIEFYDQSWALLWEKNFHKVYFTFCSRKISW